MVKSKSVKKSLKSCTINPANKLLQPGDCVWMHAQDSDKPPYIARIEKIKGNSESSKRKNVKVHIRWYYRPKELIGGQRQFHGIKEIFLSDHYDVQSADTIEGKCTMHTFKNYTKLESIGVEDYFCLFEYNASTRGFIPDRVVVTRHIRLTFTRKVSIYWGPHWNEPFGKKSIERERPLMVSSLCNYK